MNILNHFLFSFNILFLLFYSFYPKASVFEIIFFSIVFACLVDIDMLAGLKLRKPKNHLRTWVQEPFSILIIALPIAILSYFIKPVYFSLLLISYSSHILLDYLHIHEVSPLAPFSKKKIMIGIFRAYPKPSWKEPRKGISELWFLAGNVVFLIVNILFP